MMTDESKKEELSYEQLSKLNTLNKALLNEQDEEIKNLKKAISKVA